MSLEKLAQASTVDRWWEIFSFWFEVFKKDDVPEDVALKIAEEYADGAVFISHKDR